MDDSIATMEKTSNHPCPPEFEDPHSSCGGNHINLIPDESKESEWKNLMVMAAIVCMFSLCIITIAVYYVYLRRYSNTPRWNSREISRARRLSRRAAEIFFPTSARVGLDKETVDSLPVFLFKPENFKDGLSCSVCLCEFEENEKARLLPSCKHRFHVDCIDMWLYSHSTCPLCRAPVEQQSDPSVELGHTQIEVLIEEQIDVNGSSSGEQHSGCSFNGEQVEDHSKTTVVIDIK